MASTAMINTAMISVLNRSQKTRVSSAASREEGVAVGINSILTATFGDSNRASVVLCHARLFCASTTQSFVRLIGKPPRSYRGCRNNHIDNHSHSSGQNNGGDCNDHARIGLNPAPFDCPIDHAISPRRESRKHASEADHAFSQRFGDAGMAYADGCTNAGRHLAHPKAKSRNHKPQTHHGDAGPHPGKKRPLVSENLSFDLVWVEPPLFVLSIRHLVGCRSIINSFC